MTLTHFDEIFVQQMLVHCSMPNWCNYATTEKPRVDRVSMANNFYSPKLSVKRSLEHAFSID